MALKFWGGWAALLGYEYFGSRYDAHHVREALGMVLTVSIWTSHLADADQSIEIDESDVVFNKIMALSKILLPGFLWGLAFYWLMTKETGAAACAWLVVSPVFLAVMGVSVVAEPRVRWQVANGLGALGILGGHFFSYSHFGQAVTAFVSGLGTATPVTVRATLSVAFMAIGAARMVQSRLRTMSTDSSLNDSQPFLKDKRASVAVEGRPIELQEMLNVLTWTLGLALCIAAMNDAYARAILVSGSIAVVFPIAFSPPPTLTTWRLSYETYARWLLGLHMAVVIPCSLYDISK